MSPRTLELKSLILDVPDFPKKGIVFKDITPLLADAAAFRSMIEALAAPFHGAGIRLVGGIESRGFLLASAVAQKLGAGLVPIRKKGKLPRKTLCASYALEYGNDSLEVHADAAPKGAPMILVDDVLATGGTAKAACELLAALGADLRGVCFLIELDFLKGREKLAGRRVHSLVHY